MKAHGGGSPLGLRPHKRAVSAVPIADRGPAAFEPASGFRNFMTGAGATPPAPRGGGGAVPDLPSLMRRLSTAMSPTMDPADLQNDNPNIPSGFTYLAQFLAHDVVATSIPFWAVDRFYAGVRNERSSRLMLDTLYGGGPILDPLPFGPDDSAVTCRTKFRLGLMPGSGT